MARRPQLEMPRAHADSIAWPPLVWLGLACACAGFALAYGLARAPHAPARPSAMSDTSTNGLEAATLAARDARDELEAISATEAPGIGALDEPAPRDAGTLAATADAAAPAAAPAAEPVRESDREARDGLTRELARAEVRAQPRVEAERVAPIAATTEDTPSPTARSARRVEPGLIAYLRCDGIAAQRGPFPCPRDRVLEQQLRAIVEAVPDCAEAGQLGAGAFELRLELGRDGTVRELRVRAQNPGLERVVRTCVGPRAEALRTSLRSDRMIVSQRFATR